MLILGKKYKYFGIRNFKYFFSLPKILKILPELILVDQVILNISSSQFYIFTIRTREIGKN